MESGDASSNDLSPEVEALDLLYADIDEFTDKLWDALDADNKISLYVRYTDLETKEYKEKLINKNQ